jgi:lambda family phage portal protein
LRTVEIDRLSNPSNAPNTSKQRGGVDFDDYRMPLRYNIQDGHPGDAFFLNNTANSLRWETIPRRTPWGRLRVIHDFDGDRADQTRGKPLLSAVLDQFKNIDRYVKAEISAAVYNAMIWGAITTPLEHDDIVELFKNDKDGYMKSRAEHAAVRMQAGTLATLYPGDKLESFMPQRPAAGFGVFVENIEKIITIATGIPHILSKKDFAKSNYSNTRAAMADAYRGYSRRRDRLGAGWLDPSNALLMEEVVNDGRIDAPRFYEFKRAYLRGMWIGPTLVYIDKENEVKGDILSVNANMDTLERIAASRGMNWRDRDRVLQEEGG